MSKCDWVTRGILECRFIEYKFVVRVLIGWDQNEFILSPKLSCMTLSRTREKPSSSQYRSKRENWRVRNWSRSRGPMKVRWEVENLINRSINVKFISIAAPPPEQLDLIVRIANCSSRRCRAPTKAMTRISALIKIDHCQPKLQQRDEWIPSERGTSTIHEQGRSTGLRMILAWTLFYKFRIQTTGVERSYSSLSQSNSIGASSWPQTSCWRPQPSCVLGFSETLGL